jgi:hypothetical protein
MPTADHTTDWRTTLPVLHGLRASMRELRMSDAGSLLATLSTEEVARFTLLTATGLGANVTGILAGCRTTAATDFFAGAASIFLVADCVRVLAGAPRGAVAGAAAHAEVARASWLPTTRTANRAIREG